ncbi:Crp/Fnr family transcriptional regulator [Paenibacillus hexagrammi]|uniref:Crp/Fnr family transcriptional regulator n=1 Tax=Paenibacillus hexagrammi TaxID=2908839 RepID=A0ABY3SHW0_9BACL|nr:Crp/Fnr family transcriptional regulator [Paenibacillus sp. YPD9-1]UJF33614.1 Crp/Fnr family transcriptional regulator [Paenibacillus sp. YPD9-1]
MSRVSMEDWRQASMVKLKPHGSAVISSGRTLEHAAFVIQGCVRIFQVSDTGREVTLYRVRDGEACSLMMASILGETEYGASAVVEEPSEFLIVPVDAFKEWSVRYPDIHHYVYRQFILRMTQMTTLLDHIAFRPIEYRIASWLLGKAAAANDPIRITHDQLAVELGTAREVVSRALKQFEKQGFVQVSRGRILIMDRHGLESIVS